MDQWNEKQKGMKRNDSKRRTDSEGEMKRKPLDLMVSSAFIRFPVDNKYILTPHI